VTSFTKLTTNRGALFVNGSELYKTMETRCTFLDERQSRTDQQQRPEVLTLDSQQQAEVLTLVK